MIGYRIAFLVHYQHQNRFFREIALYLDERFRATIEDTRKFARLWVKDYRPSSSDLDNIISFLYKKRVARYILLKKFALLRWFFRYCLLLAARVYYNNFYRYYTKKKPDCIVVWSGNAIPLAAAVKTAQQFKIKTVFFENGALPKTIAMDPHGINFLSSIPRNPEFYKNLSQPSEKKESPKPRLVPRQPVKQNIRYDPVDLPEQYLFIPYQVFLDSQIMLFSPWIDSMERLTTLMISARDKAAPELWLVFKEHPSCKRDYTAFQRRLSSPRVLFANGNSTQELIEKSQGVVTINSSVGIESLLLGKKVVTLGQAFYNIDGLVLHADNEEELVECIRNLRTWRVSEDLRDKFLGYLREYLIEGSLREPSKKTLERIQERMEMILTGKFPGNIQKL